MVLGDFAIKVSNIFAHITDSRTPINATELRNWVIQNIPNEIYEPLLKYCEISTHDQTKSLSTFMWTWKNKRKPTAHPLEYSTPPQTEENMRKILLNSAAMMGHTEEVEHLLRICGLFLQNNDFLTRENVMFKSQEEIMNFVENATEERVWKMQLTNHGDL